MAVACRRIRSARKFSCRSGSTFSGHVVDLAHKTYEDYTSGSQPPLLVQHGLLDSRNSWSRISEAINKSTKRTVVNVDARNHGVSPHSSHHTYIHMAHDTKRLVDKLRAPKVSLLGHSMGGRTGMVLSLLYPELVSSLIVVDISPVSISESLTSSFPQVLDYVASIDLNPYTNVVAAKAIVMEMLLTFGLRQMDVLRIILNNTVMRPDGKVGWMCNIHVLNKNFTTLTRFPFMPGKIFNGPVLFIAGGKSDFIPLKDLQGIQSYFPQARVEYVPGASHNMHHEDASKTVLEKIAADFLMTAN